MTKERTNRQIWYRPQIDAKLKGKIRLAAVSENKESRVWLTELLQDYFGRMT